jgi:hypothetical protein
MDDQNEMPAEKKPYGKKEERKTPAPQKHSLQACKKASGKLPSHPFTKP